jgi:hypothetical protein
MSKIYTITLTDAEDKALNYVAMSGQEWINNVVHERCRVAIEEMFKDEVERAISNGETISGSKDEVILKSPLKSLAEKQEAQNNIPMAGE